MQIMDISLSQLKEAPWNPNQEDAAMLTRLKESISRYGLVEPLVVRTLDALGFEVLSGNHRLKILNSLGLASAPCVIVHLDDPEARLLAQALNGIHGQDDPAQKGQVLRTILSAIPPEKVLSLLPESAASLQALSSLEQEDLAQHLLAWQAARDARLQHLQLQFTHQQLATVEQALQRMLPRAKKAAWNNPNTRANAMFLICKYYLEKSETL